MPIKSTTALLCKSTENASSTQGRYGAVKLNICMKRIWTSLFLLLHTYTSMNVRDDPKKWIGGAKAIVTAWQPSDPR